MAGLFPTELFCAVCSTLEFGFNEPCFEYGLVLCATDGDLDASSVSAVGSVSGRSQASKSSYFL